MVSELGTVWSLALISSFNANKVVSAYSQLEADQAEFEHLAKPYELWE